MHITGTIWRPPYEAGSLLLEATAGCTWHRCKFCTLYDELPFSFRMSPLKDMEADLLEYQTLLHSPQGRIQARLLRQPEGEEQVRRVYLTGGNPFVLHFRRLKAIAELIRRYFPACETIGCFARVTDIGLKTDEELKELARLGYDGITIGVETGDERALAFMNKGYDAREIVAQTRRLDEAGIGYHFFYLAGISGAGRGMEGAAASAAVFNQTHPRIIGSSMLTVFPESRLYQEIQAGNWREESEGEKYGELKTLIEQLAIPVEFGALGASNAVPLWGRLPEERQALLSSLAPLCAPERERELRRYRAELRHL